MSDSYEYDVFISYRTNMEPDKCIARTVQTLLETFPVPREKWAVIADPKLKKLKVCRDLPDTNPSDNAEKSFQQKLRTSRFLIAVCTPRFGESTHCDEEVRFFRQLHGGDRVILLHVEGELSDCLSTGSTPCPYTVDIRKGETSDPVQTLLGLGFKGSEMPKYRLLSNILCCASPDDLFRRHRRHLWHERLKTLSKVGAGPRPSH